MKHKDYNGSEILKPDAGEIVLDGVNITAMHLKKKGNERRRIGACLIFYILYFIFYIGERLNVRQYYGMDKAQFENN